MSTNFYSLYDKKLESFNFPFAMDDEKKALVTIQREVEAGKGIIAQCPADFILYKLFAFDQDSGLVVPDLVLIQDLALLPWARGGGKDGGIS